MLFWKRKAEKSLGDSSESPLISSVKIIEDEFKKPKTNPINIVSFKSIDDTNTNIYMGVVLKTVVYKKAKSVLTRDVFIVSVCNVNGRNVTPYLKWINNSLCKTISDKQSLNSIPSKYFDYKWMAQYEETKRLKRIRSERTLQETDGGEI